MDNEILNGNSAELLVDLPEAQVDLVVTDPPYGVNYRDRVGRRVAGDDDLAVTLSVFESLYRVMRPDSFCISFYGWGAVDRFMAAWKGAGFEVGGHIVWTKSYASRQRYLGYHHEQAYVLVKGRPARPAVPIPDVQPWVWSGNRAHPTEKAVDILQPLIRSFSKPGDLVADPFAGSGSTLVAAALSGRRYLGMELDPRYCALARRRLAGVARYQEQEDALMMV